MSLAAGFRIGPYEVLGSLGAGGMGEVYRATDTHLKRAVAIKVLPASVAGDADRLARFQREAEVLAALNHPNIAGIYGLEKTPDVTALVMELVEGDDLSQRIARGRSAGASTGPAGMPLDEALPIARQIAEALEAAHEAGIIHRDLKPANIKVRADGTVKVLDFGLAKATGVVPGGRDFSPADQAASPTITSPAMTQMGMILGTAAYMSPEQAKGRAVDRRTDIFAFGCVLYEMITGRRTFDGEDVTDVLGAVVRLEPDWSRLPAGCPAALHKLLRLCLEKNVRNRRSSATDVRLDLEGLLKDPPPATSVAPVPVRARTAWLPWMAATLLLVTTIAFAVPYFRLPPPPAVVRFQVAVPEGTEGPGAQLAVSPDGKHLVFAASTGFGQSQLYVRSLETGDTRPLPGTERGQAPFWSPDSLFVGFFATGDLKKVDLGGGPARTLCRAQTGATGTWNATGTIVFSTASPGGLVGVSADGGTPSPLTTPDASRGELVHVTPHFLPDGNRFLYAVQASKRETSGTYVGSLDGTPSIQILAESQKAQFAAPNQLVFVRNDALFSQSFDPGSLRLTGEPTRLAESVSRGANRVTGRAGFSVADTGVLVVIPERATTETLDLSWYDQAGRVLTQVGLANYRGFELSPDGKRLAAHRHDDETGSGDIWITDLERGTDRRFTFDPSQDPAGPIWSPDGTTIAFVAQRNGPWGLYRKPADGSGTDELLFESDTPKIPMAWSPDGTAIVFVNYDPKSGSDLWILPLSGDRKPAVYLQTPMGEAHPQISPDGRWIAYASGGVWVQSYPVRGTTYQVSSTGIQPRWRADGKALFMGSPRGRILAVAVESSGRALTFGAPQTLFDSQWANLPHASASGTNTNTFIYAVARDGQKFLIQRRPTQADADEPTMTVILNWTTLLTKP